MSNNIRVFLVDAPGDGSFKMPDGSVVSHDELPAGAAWYLKRWFVCGPDGKTLAVRIPGNYTWIVDDRCSNCTLPNDKEHRCWVRHGSVEDGTLHVDKNGLTCSAGAGSIIGPDGWHGFLHHGHLVQI